MHLERLMHKVIWVHSPPVLYLLHMRNQPSQMVNSWSQKFGPLTLMCQLIVGVSVSITTLPRILSNFTTTVTPHAQYPFMCKDLTIIHIHNTHMVIIYLLHYLLVKFHKIGRSWKGLSTSTYHSWADVRVHPIQINGMQSKQKYLTTCIHSNVSESIHNDISLVEN